MIPYYNHCIDCINIPYNLSSLDDYIKLCNSYIKLYFPSTRELEYIKMDKLKEIILSLSFLDDSNILLRLARLEFIKLNDTQIN